MNLGKIIKTYISPILLGILLYMILYALFHPFLVTGSSMYPTYKDNDIVFCTVKFEPSSLSRGSIIIYRHEHFNLIKRIVALPGDRVQIIDGILYVNGEESEFNYEKIEDPGILSEELTVKEDEIIYLGDNRNHSGDSRIYGPGTIANIKAIVKTDNKN